MPSRLGGQGGTDLYLLLDRLLEVPSTANAWVVWAPRGERAALEGGRLTATLAAVTDSCVVVARR